MKSAKHYTRRAQRLPRHSCHRSWLPLFTVFARLSCLCEAVTPGCRPSLPGPASVLRLTLVLYLPFTTCSMLAPHSRGSRNALVARLFSSPHSSDCLGSVRTHTNERPRARRHRRRRRHHIAFSPPRSDGKKYLHVRPEVTR